MDNQTQLTAPAAQPNGRFGRGLRIAYIGSKCLLDDASGIAHSIHAILEALARHGAEATSFSAALFDTNSEVVLEDRIAQTGSTMTADRNGIVQVTRSQVRHFVMRTESSRKYALTGEECRRMQQACRAFLAARTPDIVITYGTGSHARHLHAAIRATGAQVVFYLGNAEIPGSDWFHSGDRAICPSQFLAAHYGARLSGPVDVVHPIIAPDRFVAEPGPGDSRSDAERRRGYVTLINPVPQKGLTLLIELARRAAQDRPDMRFLVLEGLMTRDVLRQASVDLTSLPNVHLLPVQRDMASIYARTSMLLMPSYWREGFGRAAVEAHLSGVPVLASTHGGLPEALNGAGRLLDIPAVCRSDPFQFPDPETVTRWWNALTSLWDDEAAYGVAVREARAAGQKFHPERTTKSAIAFFTGSPPLRRRARRRLLSRRPELIRDAKAPQAWRYLRGGFWRRRAGRRAEGKSPQGSEAP